MTPAPAVHAQPLLSLRPHFQNIEAVLFDLDGTLIDSDDVAVQQLTQRLRPVFKNRAPRMARWALMQAETPGNALITLFDMLHVDQSIMALAHRLLAEREKSFRLIAGVEEAVVQLSARYRIGLVTTRNRATLDRFLAEHPRLASVIGASCGAQDTIRLKPHPAPVRWAADRLGVAPGRCIMVGDTPMDTLAGSRAGALAVGVLSGFGRRRELVRNGAHLVLRSSAELPALLLPDTTEES